MRDAFITIENVCEAAALLVTVDTYHIKPEVIEDADDFIFALKIALENFHKPFRQNENAHSPNILFDDRLSALLDATKNLYAILTENGKDVVKQFIENKKNHAG